MNKWLEDMTLCILAVTTCWNHVIILCIVLWRHKRSSASTGFMINVC